jgi:hypothetical protein
VVEEQIDGVCGVAPGKSRRSGDVVVSHAQLNGQSQEAGRDHKNERK